LPVLPDDGAGQPRGRLALFDLDNTLLSGDSDVLWCAFLVARGVLPSSFEETNRALEHEYRSGQATAAAFSEFFASTLAGRTPQEWHSLREDFMAEAIRPRIPAAASALLEQHRAADDVLILTSATNRFLCEQTADELGVHHLIATELAQLPDGRFSGALRGTLNMREGKVQRLRDWLVARDAGSVEAALDSAIFYSDSINDLPLLSAVGQAVAVDPDAHLLREAQQRGWPVLRLQR